MNVATPIAPEGPDASWNFGSPEVDAADARERFLRRLSVIQIKAQSWFDFLHGKAELASDAHVDRIPKTLPIHVIAGTHDPVGEDTKGVERLLTVYRKKGLTISSKFYDDARHELVNELNRDDVTEDLIAWLLQFAQR